jgi:SAM-dependent methyltransferase
MGYYQHDLALVHARGYGQHADSCAPGILDLLSPVVGGLILELGCGAGALTRHLRSAGHRVIATDASPDMLELARAARGPRTRCPRARSLAAGRGSEQQPDHRSGRQHQPSLPWPR